MTMTPTQRIEGDQRAYREIDPSRDDDERHSQRDHSRVGDLAEYVHQVARPSEERTEKGRDHEQDHEGYKNAEYFW